MTSYAHQPPAGSGPFVTLYWVLEDVETEDPRLTYYISREIGSVWSWPLIGDRVSLPAPLTGRSPDGSSEGKVSDVEWSADLGRVGIWAYAQVHGFEYEDLLNMGEGWLRDGVSAAGEGADAY